MTKVTQSPIPPIHKLITLIPNTDLSKILGETFELAKKEPKILDLIVDDQDKLALEKKEGRLKDKAWEKAQGERLPGFDDTEDASNDLSLSTGRPRMPPMVVLIFAVMRGYLGGFKDRKVFMTLRESITVEACMLNQGYTALPGASTIIDNVNSISDKTLQVILDTQIKMAQAENLDDFKELIGDSTSVAANSAWPTESGLIAGLLERCFRIIGMLNDDGVIVKIPKIVETLIEEIKTDHKIIQLTSGKKNSAKKRNKLYNKLLRAARKVLKEMKKALISASESLQSMKVLPSLFTRLSDILDGFKVDIRDIQATIDNANSRINKNKKVKAGDKVLSLADENAAMIVKGQREPVLGYKPQIVMSKKGMITAIVVPEGNAADSSQLRPIVELSIARTGIIPSVLSFDDGYSNTEVREYFLAMGISVVSISGSKGRKITPEDSYESDAYKQARNDRSAVESLIFTLKNNTGLGQLKRLGIDSVRSELTEKAITHNLFRLITLRGRQQQKAAA